MVIINSACSNIYYSDDQIIKGTVDIMKLFDKNIKKTNRVS